MALQMWAFWTNENNKARKYALKGSASDALAFGLKMKQSGADVRAVRPLRGEAGAEPEKYGFRTPEQFVPVKPRRIAWRCVR